MIAVALGLISVVVMVATGVVVSSSGEDRLTFLGVGVETTTAQVFVTGAIFAWVFIVALWLLRIGMQKSGARCAELAGRWAGFGTAFTDADAYDAQHDDERPGRVDSARLRLAAIGLATIDLSRLDLAGFGGAGAAGDGGGAPRRRGGGSDLADVAVAVAGDERRALGVDGGLSPAAWTVGGAAAAIGIRVGRRGQRREVGGGAGSVAGESSRAERERRQGVRGD